MEPRIDPMELDDVIDTLVRMAEWAGVPEPIDWMLAARLTGCSRATYYRAMEQMLIVAGARLLSGYRATSNRARGVRHLAYTEGWIVAPPRTSKIDADHQRSVDAWGTRKRKVWGPAEVRA